MENTENESLFILPRMSTTSGDLTPNYNLIKHLRTDKYNTTQSPVPNTTVNTSKSRFSGLYYAESIVLTTLLKC